MNAISGRSARHGADLAEAISVQQLLAIIRRRKLSLILPTILLTAAAVLYAKTLPNEYEARVLLMAEFPIAASVLARNTNNVGSEMAAIQETIRRRSFLEEVLIDSGLYDSPDGTVPDVYLDEVRANLWTAVEGPDTFHFIYHGNDAEEVTTMVSKVAEVFAERTNLARAARVAARVELLRSEVTSAEEELITSQEAVAAYRRSAIERLPENLQIYLGASNRITSQIQSINTTISNEQVKRAEVQAEVEQLEAMMSEADLSNVTPQMTQLDPGLRQRYEQLLTDLSQARRRYTEQHPEVVRLKSELEAIQLQMIDNGADPGLATDVRSSNGDPSALVSSSDMRLRYVELRGDLQGIDERISLLDQEKADLRQQLAEYEERVESIPESERELQELVREYEFSRSRYLDLLSRLEEAETEGRLGAFAGPIRYEVIEPARVPSIPTGPNRRRLALMGLLAGLFVSGVIVFSRHQLDTTFSEGAEVEEATGIKVIGTIPTLFRSSILPGREGDQRSSIVTLTDPESLASQQYRILASRLRNAMDRECSQILLVTSTAGAEGKTTTALNLSLALSELQDDRVLLIDGDLRRPAVSRSLQEALGDNFTPALHGFADLLKQPRGPVSGYIRKVGSLYVMSGGEGSEDSSGLVSSSLPPAVSILRRHFKYIIIDSPPILFMVDSHLLANSADRVLMVVRAHQTSAEVLRRALDQYDRTRILGTVFNDVPFDQGSYRSAYAYYSERYETSGRGRARIWR